MRHKSESALRLSEISRPSTPKDVADLGQDYSRYPSSTRSESRSSSQVRPGAYTFQTTSQTSQTSLLRATSGNPFNDSQADLKTLNYHDGRIRVFDPYFGGEQGFIKYADEFEDDDHFHTPADDDDEKFRPKLKDYLEARHIVSTIGATFLIWGLCCIFIVIPIVTFHTKLFVHKDNPSFADLYGPEWAHVNNKSYSLMKNVRKCLIDPDTPASAKHRKSTFDGSTLNLVFSDEFNENNRTFYPRDDPY